MADTKKVFDLIKQHEAKYVDFRFTDPRGKLQHLTQHVDTIDDTAIAEGIMFDGSSIAGWKAINESDIGLTPSNDGNVVRLVVPELTEERRRELVKIVRNLAEEGRVAVRNVRRDGMDALKKMEKDGKISQDEHRHQSDAVQKLTDDHIKKVDDTLGVVHTHGVAGLIGGLLVGVLADPHVVLYPGNGKDVPDVTAAGWLWGHHPAQILIQLGAALTIIVWDGFVTFAILRILGLFMKLRAADEVLELGDIGVH